MSFILPEPLHQLNAQFSRSLMLKAFSLSRFRFVLEPEGRLALHSRNPGNTLRGAFGSTFKRLVCPTPHDCRDTCRMKATCPYGQIFEPSPPPGSDRLRLNQDIPRPFILRPPTGPNTATESGATLSFELNLVGLATEYLPYFLVTFRELGEQGIGIGRGRYTISRVLALQESAIRDLQPTTRNPLPVTRESQFAPGDPLPAAHDPLAAIHAPQATLCNQPSLLADNGPRMTDNGAVEIYSSTDQLVRPSPHRFTFDDCRRLAVKFYSAIGQRVTGNGSRITVRFLTPTHLKADGKIVTQPDFHHLIKRLRDRINALAHFYCNDGLNLDHKEFGRRAEAVRTVACHVRWEERDRRSWKTGLAHDMGGFVGEVTYEGDLEEFLSLLILGQYTHVGKYAVWGHGQYEIV